MVGLFHMPKKIPKSSLTSGGGGAGALREPMDSNRSFPVMSTIKIVLAAFEIFWHMHRSSKSFLGLG